MIMDNVATSPKDVTSVAGNNTDDDRLKKLEKYKNIVNELINTEKTLVNDMEQIFNGYASLIMSEDDCPHTKICISNIAGIISLGKELIKGIEQAKDSPLDIAKIFNELKLNIKVNYSQYCTTYPSCSLELERLRTNQNFSKHIKVSDYKHELLLDVQKKLNHLLPLESYLLKPVQRIMKYPLLLQSIAKLNLLDEKSQELLQETHKNMSKISEYINEKKREMEGISLIDHFNGIITNLREPLTLEKVGPVQLHNEFCKGSKKMVAILFSKILLLTKPQSDGKLSLFRAFPISDIILLENSSKSSTAFEISSYTKRKKATCFEAKKSDIKDQWVTHIKALILENMALNFNDIKLSAMLGEKVGSHVSTILSVKEDVANSKHIPASNLKAVFDEERTTHNNHSNEFPKLSKTESVYSKASSIGDENISLYSIDNLLETQKKDVNESVVRNSQDYCDKATTALNLLHTISDYNRTNEINEDKRKMYESVPWSKQLIEEAIIETENILGNEIDTIHSPSSITSSNITDGEISTTESSMKESKRMKPPLPSKTCKRNNSVISSSKQSHSSSKSVVSNEKSKISLLSVKGVNVSGDKLLTSESETSPIKSINSTENRAKKIIKKYESIDLEQQPTSTTEEIPQVTESLASRVQKLFERKDSKEIELTKHRRITPSKASLIGQKLMALQEKVMVDIQVSGFNSHNQPHHKKKK